MKHDPPCFLESIIHIMNKNFFKIDKDSRINQSLKEISQLKAQTTYICLYNNNGSQVPLSILQLHTYVYVVLLKI